MEIRIEAIRIREGVRRRPGDEATGQVEAAGWEWEAGGGEITLRLPSGRNC